MIGYLLALLRVVSDVTLLTARKKLREAYDASYLLVAQSVLSLILGILGFIVFKPTLLLPIVLFCCLSVFFVSISNILSIYAFKFDDFSKLAPLTGVSVIYALILGMVTLDQIPTSIQLLGILLVVIGIYLQGNDGKWKYPLHILKQKPVLLFLLAPLFSIISRVFINKTLVLTSVFDVVVLNLLFSLPIVLVMYLIIKKGNFSASPSKHLVWWFAPLLIAEAASVILNVVAMHYLDLVIAELIFSLNILLTLIVGKLFFGEKIQYRIIPVFLIFIGVVLSIAF